MKIFNWIRNVLCVIAAAILIAALACLLLRIKPAVVMSGSMEPAFHVGSVVLIAKGREAEVGDAIAFEIGGNYITHRIIGEDEGGWITKGDNNKTEDPWRVEKDKVDGKVILSIPLLGYVFHFLTSKRGLIISIAVILCLILSLAMSEIGDDDEEEKKKPAAAEQEAIAEQDIKIKELEKALADMNERYGNLSARHITMVSLFEKKGMLQAGAADKEKEVLQQL